MTVRMLSKLNSFSTKYIIEFYFLLSGIDGFLCMIGLISLAKFTMLLNVFALFIVLEQFIKSPKWIDWFILFFILFILFVSSLENYNSELIYFGFRHQLLLTLFFIVGENPRLASWQIFRKAKNPILIISIIGLILFVTQPSWYISWKMTMWADDVSNSRILEMARLSAFWEYPYWISYGCALLYIFIIYRLYLKGSKAKVLDVVVLSFLLLIMLLAQQRAPILFILSITLSYLFVSIVRRTKDIAYFRKQLVLLVALIFIGIVILFSFLDADVLISINRKIEALSGSSNESFLSHRMSLFSDIKGQGNSFFGAGIGKYSHEAFRLGKQAITDQQYYAVYMETGIAGCIGYLIIIGSVIIRGLNNFKYYYFELSVVLFYLLAMFGANPLSSEPLHTIIFWLCCGRIYNKKCLRVNIDRNSI